MNLKCFLLVALLFSGIQTATADTGKLPFVGTRYFNFHMGMFNEQAIVINKNGMVTITHVGVDGEVNEHESGEYKGKYKTLMPAEEKGTYYHIHGNKISLVNKHKKVLRNCENNVFIVGKQCLYQHIR